MILYICTGEYVQYIFEIYLPVREHTWLIGSGGQFLYSISIFNFYVLTILKHRQQNTHTCVHRTCISIFWVNRALLSVRRALLSVYGTIPIFWTVFNKRRTHMCTEHIYIGHFWVFMEQFIYFLTIHVFWQVLYSVYRALLSVYRALLSVHRALLSVYRALLSVYRALLSVYRALLSVYGTIHIFSDHSCILWQVLYSAKETYIL